MSAVTSRFVYISRRRDDIIESATIGEFLSLKLDLQDSIEKPHKFPSHEYIKPTFVQIIKQSNDNDDNL